MGVRRAIVSPEFAQTSSAVIALRRAWGERRSPVLMALLIALVSVWSFWPTLTQLFGEWIHNPQYSHGLLVPAFSAMLLWMRRDRYPARTMPAVIPGLVLLAIGSFCRIFGGFMYVDWLDSVSFLPCLLGLILTFGGWATLRWAAAPTLFLAFMVPMPFRMTIWLGFPLQQLATTVSTYVLQTLGQPAVAEGNTILIRDFQLSIVKACSGLSMLVTFVTFSTAVCLVVTKPLIDKLLILLSAIPIALLANVIRIVVTGLMFLHVSDHAAAAIFHDAAGWFMMPLALAFLGAELWILKHLFVDRSLRPVFSGVRSQEPGAKRFLRFRL